MQLRKLICVWIFICLCSLSTQAYMPYFDVKAKLLCGTIIKHNKHLENTVKNPTLGIEASIEFLPQGKYTWEKYYNYPIIGVGLIGMDLGNTQIFGQAFAAYPYLLAPLVRTSHFNMNLKVGAGLAIVTKTWNDGDTKNGVNSANANAAIGSHLNIFLPIGANFDFPIKKGFSITSDLMLNHISNGSIMQPNSGLNIINCYLGVAYRPNWREYMMPWRDYIKDMPRNWQLEFAASGGSRELYYKDNVYYGVASGRISLYRQLANIYKLGISADAFYDGVFTMQGINSLYTSYKRYYIEKNDSRNKFRVGISIANEFVIGRITAGLHWGIYIFDPIRNAYNLPNSKYGNRSFGYKRNFLYKYNIEEEDGWNYFQLLIKCRIWNQLFVSAELKTHLQKAEFVTFGIGYTIHFKEKKSPHSVLW